MPLSEIILAVAGLLTVAMLAAGVCRNLAIPYTVFLVILGMLLGWLARSFHHLQFLLEFQLTPDLVLFLFLPALIFESAFNLDARHLLKDLAPVLTLAVPALLLSTAVIGAGLWLILGLDPRLSLLFGALISATDPVAVIALFRELGAPERLTVLVEGESLLNDATAIVVFNILLGLAVSGAFAWTDAGLAVVEFLRVFLGGILVGAVIGLAVSELLYRLFNGLNAVIIMSIVIAYASFVIAEHSLHVSGVMAVVAAAISVGALWVSRIPQEDILVIRETWEVIALVCNSLLFLLVGLSVNIGNLVAATDIILVAVALVLVARAAAIHSLVPATTRLFSLPRVQRVERHIMWWGGLKGGLAIAIALSIPPDLPGRDLLLTITLGVVIFSLVVNAPTIRPLIRRLGIDRLTPEEMAAYRQVLGQAGREAAAALDRFQDNSLMTRGAGHLVRKQTRDLFAAEAPDVAGDQTLRQLRDMALRIEFDELKHVYDIGLIRHYTYLDMKNNLLRYRDSLGAGAARQSLAGQGESPFLQFENAVLKRLREHDWAASLLARYQNLRLSQRIRRDIAGVLICTAVLDMLQAQEEADPAQKAQVADEYRQRLQRRKTRLDEIAEDFPDFYGRFEANLYTQVALCAARHYLAREHQSGAVGAKAYARLERMINKALDTIPPISDPGPRLSALELIGTVPLLRGLSEGMLEQLAECSTAVTFLQDDLIIEEGERGDALYIITHGVVQVFMDNRFITELRKGDFFGEMALLGDHVRKATVKARIPTTLLRLSRHDVLRLAESDPELKRRLTEAGEQRRREDRLLNL